jgi:hypothetical protein
MSARTVFCLSLGCAAVVLACVPAAGDFIPVSQSRSVTANTTARGGAWGPVVTNDSTETVTTAGVYQRAYSNYSFSRDENWLPFTQSSSTADASLNSQIGPALLAGSANLLARIDSVTGSARGVARVEFVSVFTLDAPGELTLAAHMKVVASPHGGDWSRYAARFALTGWPLDMSQPPSTWPIDFSEVNNFVGSNSVAGFDRYFNYFGVLEPGVPYTLRASIELDVPINSSLNYYYQETGMFDFSLSVVNVPEPVAGVVLAVPVLAMRRRR